MIGMGAKSITIVRAEAADFFCDCWAVKIPSDERVGDMESNPHKIIKIELDMMLRKILCPKIRHFTGIFCTDSLSEAMKTTGYSMQMLKFEHGVSEIHRSEALQFKTT
jgi:hypothetical protein